MINVIRRIKNNPVYKAYLCLKTFYRMLPRYRSVTILLTFLFLVVGSVILYGQQENCVEKDLPQILFKKKGDEVTPKIVIKKPTIILFPVLASSPATGFQFGAVGQGAWFMGT